LRARPDEYVAHYQRAVYLMVMLSMPLVTFAFVAADDLVLTLLGPSWVGTSTLFRALAPGALLGTFNVATGWVYLSLGTTSRQFRFGSLVAIVMVIAFAVGLSWGPLGVAIAFSVVTCVLRYPGIVYCFRGTPLEPSDLAGVLWKPLVAAFSASAICWLCGAFLLTAEDQRLRLVVEAGVFFAAYALALAVLPRGRMDLRGVLSQMTDRG
jgi:O-antigen/teichoic acid export membrane protein